MAVLKDRPVWRGRRLRSRREPEEVDRSTTAGASTTRPLKPAGRRKVQKAAGKDWHSHYRLTVEVGLAAALGLLVWLTTAPIHQTRSTFDVTLSQQEVVEMEEIQPTKQALKPPPPPRPPVPVEVANDAILDDDELDLDVTLDLNESAAYIPPPPAEPAREEEEEDLAEIFVVVEEMPEIIGGPGKIYEYLEYPTIARQAQMEGLVVIQVVVEPDGSGSSPVIVRSAGKVLDDAALAAVAKLRYKPGRQRGRPVRVKLAIPIRFMLKGRG